MSCGVLELHRALVDIERPCECEECAIVRARVRAAGERIVGLLKGNPYPPERVADLLEEEPH